ncbi:FusB/FusC family EF-G-binding protein [Paenibacillus sp. NPDC058174]|uniref:FusB/FusC family EF-G-binding protein n=1 Tax=Paenibacillus sp. NPDC058174 TaxID=3346366 RepID=UPI0036DBF6CF
MNTPFIRNHQFNFIKKQIKMLQNACTTVSDMKIVESVRTGVLTAITELFPQATEGQKQLLEQCATAKTAVEFQQYIDSLVPYLEEFTPVTDQQLKKLFPKIKKLKLPDLNEVDYRYTTYLGWSDIASSRRFLAYHLNGKLVGVEGRITPANKKTICFVCNRLEEVALFTAITKAKPANASPDYYKAIGQYMCLNSETCNGNVTDTDKLEKFIEDVTSTVYKN